MEEEAHSGVHVHGFTVPPEVIDANGHVNNVAYVQWMQDVAIRHFRSLGGEEMMHAAGASWVARSHRIEYLRPAFAGDRLEIRTWIADMERVTSKRCYEFCRDGEEKPVARGETEWVFVDAGSGRPKRIPEEMKAAVKRR